MEFGCSFLLQDRGSSQLYRANGSNGFSWEDAAFPPRMCKSGKQAVLTQCRLCHPRGEIPTSFTPVFRVSGCQLSSRALPCEWFGCSRSHRACDRAGRVRIMLSCHLLADCRRVCLSRTVCVPSALPCPLQMYLSQHASPVRSA